ncbi:hypothetical protein [Leifsonia xyli]|uniref:hypothetical protein n=1 Tax=Leifsonia xyli TaxID=1575 RepID=UPI003D669CB6
MTLSDEAITEEVAVRRFDAGGSEIALFEFQGQLRDLMVSSMRNSYLTTGSYTNDARAVSSQGVLSMAATGAAAGGTALSAAFSSTLYMATADPSTLMKLGAGVGSTVMGANGFVAQAPFVAVSSALPVVAPIMAMQSLTTVVMLQKFKEVDRKLEEIKSTLDKAIARSEATHAGELLTASTIVDELNGQYEFAGEFSNDMLIRLALAENTVRSLAERFRLLLDSHSPAQIEDLGDVQQANYDAYSAALASFLDLRVSYLRVCVDMQENPKSVQPSVNRLKASIVEVTAFWERLLNRSEGVRSAIHERETRLNDMNWAERALPVGRRSATEKQLKVLKEAYTTTMESERSIIDGFHELVRSAKQTLTALEDSKAAVGGSPTLVYWQDESGEHSFATESIRAL